MLRVILPVAVIQLRERLQCIASHILQRQEFAALQAIIPLLLTVFAKDLRHLLGGESGCLQGQQQIPLLHTHMRADRRHEPHLLLLQGVRDHYLSHLFQHREPILHELEQLFLLHLRIQREGVRVQGLEHGGQDGCSPSLRRRIAACCSGHVVVQRTPQSLLGVYGIGNTGEHLVPRVIQFETEGGFFLLIVLKLHTPHCQGAIVPEV